MTSATLSCLRPLLDVNQAWSALELGPRGIGLAASSQLFAHGQNQPQPSPLPWLVPLSGTDLNHSGLARQLPPQQVSLLLPAEVWLDAAGAARCQELAKQGYRLGADVDSAPALEQCAEAGAQLLRLDAATAREQVSPVLLNRLKEKGLTLVADGVSSHDLFVWCGARGFTLMSGEFVPQPEECPTSPADPTKLRLLKLLSLIVQDADTREIEEMIKQEPKLSYNLLRLVNSVSVGATTKITSFAQAITLLGRRQLQRWLQLLIYANQFNAGSQPNPLMPQAALRGRLVELIALAAHPEAAEDPDFHDCAYMAGAFSLLDVLLHLPMDSVLAALPLADEVAEAVGRHQGPLGDALSLVESLERGLPAPDTALLEKLRLRGDTLGQLQVDALAWVSHIDVA